MAIEPKADQGLLATAERARDALRMMMLIRRFEERAEEQYTRARIGGYCHLAIGEEAANVGPIAALREGDVVFASYRDHGTALAVGSCAEAALSNKNARQRPARKRESMRAAA